MATALYIAREQNLDLVEVAPEAKPPVCRVMDYGKFLYEQQKREKGNRHKSVEPKEIRLSAVMEDHDVETKINQLRQFLAKGKPVKLTLQFYGRQVTHPEEGRRIIDKMINSVTDLGTVKNQPSQDGKYITAKIVPLQ